MSNDITPPAANDDVLRFARSKLDEASMNCEAARFALKAAVAAKYDAIRSLQVVENIVKERTQNDCN